MRILIVRAGALGDVLLLRPTLHALRSAGHTVTLVAPSIAARLLWAEVVSIVPWEGRDIAQLLASAPPAGLAGHDLGVAFTRSAELASALRQLMPVRTRDPLPPAGVHAAVWARETVADLAPDEASLPPLAVTPEARQRAEPLLAQLGEGFLAIHPGSGSPSKAWPRDRYRALARDLADSHAPQPFLVVEGPADREAATAFADDPGAVFARGLDLATLGALLARARLLIGNDSGVAHLAAAFGAPCLVLFGPTDPRQWRPLGPSVHTLQAATRDLDTLSLEQVLAAARPLARSSGREPPSG